MAWIMFLAEFLLHVPATAGSAALMRMTAPLRGVGDILHLQIVFCSLDTDMRSFPRYVVEWKKTKTLNSVSSRGGGRIRGCLAQRHPIDKVSTGRRKGWWERALPLNEYFDCFWVSIHMEWNSLPSE